jgi:hypothetical protein
MCRSRPSPCRISVFGSMQLRQIVPDPAWRLHVSGLLLIRASARARLAWVFHPAGDDGRVGAGFGAVNR